MGMKEWHSIKASLGKLLLCARCKQYPLNDVIPFPHSWNGKFRWLPENPENGTQNWQPKTWFYACQRKSQNTNVYIISKCLKTGEIKMGISEQPCIGTTARHHCRGCGTVCCEYCAPMRKFDFKNTGPHAGWWGEIYHRNGTRKGREQRLCQKCVDYIERDPNGKYYTMLFGK